MQSNKLMFHLIIYVLVFTIIIFLVGKILNYYYNNIKDLSHEVSAISEFTKFDLYMLKTVKTREINIRKIGMIDDDESSYYITFQKEDGTTDSFIKKGNVLYYNQMKLCENVDFFRVVVDRSEKESITVNISLFGETYSAQYVIS